MNKKTLKKIAIVFFILLSLIIIGMGIMFILSQMVNIKYYFDSTLPDNNESVMPIWSEEFITELILYAKWIIGYAVLGLILSIYTYKKIE